MNHIYKTTYNRALGSWVAVPETACIHGKSSTRAGRPRFIRHALAAALFFVAVPGLAAPVMSNGTGSNSLTISPNPANPAQAIGTDDIAVGRGSVANSNKIKGPKRGAIAIGGESQSVNKETIAIGYGTIAKESQGIAIGAETKALGDQSTALGNNVVATGNSSVAIGGDDLDTVSTGATGLNSSTTATTYKDLTGADLVDRRDQYRPTTTGAAAVAVGVQAQATGELSTAFGTKTTASGLAATALGVGANASKANAVALGSGSTTADDASGVNRAEIGTGASKITYTGFAGGANIKPGDQVSVGSAGYERQIKHVAPGAINANSTDAINGSQLYAIANNMNFKVNADNNDVKTHQMTKELLFAAGNAAETTSSANLKTEVTQDANSGKTTVTIKMKEAPEFTSVTAKDAAGNKTVMNSTGLAITATGSNPVSLTKDGLNNGGNRITKVKAGENDDDAVNVKQLNTSINNSVNAAKTHYYSVNDGNNRQGNYNNDGATGDNSLAAGAGASATGKNTVAVGLNARAGNDGAVAVGSDTQATNASTALGDHSTATGLNATALGWQANAAGRADVFIGKKAGAGTTNNTNNQHSNIGIGESAVADVGSTKAVNNVIGIGTGAAKGIQESHNIAIGAYANGIDSGNPQVTTSNNIAIGQRAYAKGGNSIALGQSTKAEGKAALAFGVSASAVGHNSLAVGQLANASGTGSVAIGGAAQPTNAAQAGGSQAIAIGQGSNAAGIQATAVGVNAKASHTKAVALGSESETAAAVGTNEATVNGIKYNGFAGKTPIATVSVGKAGGERTITNVAAGRINATSTDAINGSQLYLTQQALGNVGKTTAATLGGNAEMDEDGNITMTNVGGTGENTVHDAIKAVNKTANAGWNFQVNGGTSENVKPNETVKFKDGDNIAITNNGKEITIATKPDLKADTLTINNGGPVINGSGIDMKDKKITGLANGDVSASSKDAVNGSQLFQTNQNISNNSTAIAKGINFGGTTGSNKYALGDTINVKGDSNIVSTTVAGGVQLGLGNVINVGSSKPVKIDGDNGHVTGLTNTTWNPNNITSGRAATEDQLKNVATEAAKHTTVVAGDNVTVDTGTNASGGNEYTIHAEKTVVAQPSGGSVSVTPRQSGNHTTTYDVDLTQQTKDDIQKGVDAKDAVDNKGLTYTGDSGTTGTKKLGDTVAVNGDNKNISTSADANGIKVAMKDDIEVTSVKAGDTTINNNGITIDNGAAGAPVSLTKDGLDNGGNKITNVAAGSDDNDAVNYSQLKAVAARPPVINNTNITQVFNNTTVSGGKNTRVRQSGDNYRVELADDIALNSVTTGDARMNPDGFAIAGNSLDKGGLTVNGDTYVSADGLNANNRTIQNVAPGRIAPDSQDAVNGAQLYALGQRMDGMGKRIDSARAGVASAIATAGLPQAYRPGASMVAAAGGYYDGQSAIAVGLSTISDNGRWIIKGAANVNSKEAGASIGVGYQW